MKREHTEYVQARPNPANPAKWTEEERARIDAIREEDIDYSDEPPVTDFSGFKRHGSEARKAAASINGAAKRKPVAESKGHVT
jgi:hypothetical protein